MNYVAFSFLFPQIDPKVAFPRRAQPKVRKKAQGETVSGAQRVGLLLGNSDARFTRVEWSFKQSWNTLV